MEPAAKMATNGRTGSWSPFRCRGGGEGEDCTGGVGLALLLEEEVLEKRTLTAMCLGRGARNVENDLGPTCLQGCMSKKVEAGPGRKVVSNHTPLSMTPSIPLDKQNSHTLAPRTFMG